MSMGGCRLPRCLGDLRRRLGFHECRRGISGSRTGDNGKVDERSREEDAAEGLAEQDHEMQGRIASYFHRRPGKLATPVPTRDKELEAINRFKQRARRAKELEHKRYQTMMNKVGAAVQRQSVEDTFAKAEKLYLSRAQVAEGAKALSVSQCLDALQESLDELRSRYGDARSDRGGGARGKQQMEVEQPLELGKGRARRPERFQSAETDRIKEIAGRWIQSAKSIGNLRVEHEVRTTLKDVYGVDIVERVEDVRKFIDELDSDQGCLARYFKERMKSGGVRVVPAETYDEEEETEFEDIESDREHVGLDEEDEEDEGEDRQGEVHRVPRTRPGPFLYALCPIADIIQHLRGLNIIAGKTRLPIPVSSITNLPDATIINWFRNKAFLILKQYRPANNLWELRRLINYHIRYSLIYTLAKKHKYSISKTIKLYGKAPSVKIPTMVIQGQVVLETIAEFPTVHQVNSIRRGFDKETMTPQEFIDRLLTGCKRDGAIADTIPGMCNSRMELQNS